MKLTSVGKPGVGVPKAHVPPAPVVASVAAGHDGDAQLLVSGRAPPALLETIIGTDERTRITATADAPWRMICALAIESDWGNFIGTGWFAGPRTIITAGHVVFDEEQMNGWAKRITVTPGQSDAAAPFGSFVATRFSSLSPWTKARDADYDIGVIHCDAVPGKPDPGTATGWFGVQAMTDAQLMAAMVNVAGYPADKGGTEQWWAKNSVKAVTPRRLFYQVDTVGGQSGAPAFVLDADRKPLVVGIHAYGTGGTPASVPMEVNSAPRIIPEVAAQIGKWVAADT